jgi:hypothetical protein
MEKGYKPSSKNLKTETKSLNQAFPFTQPENYQFSNERYKEFLSVRKTATQLAQEKIGWLVRFSEDPESSGLTTVQLVLNFVGLPVSLADVGLGLIDGLKEANMSLNEYQYFYWSYIFCFAFMERRT